jgi:hypothetical protein
MPGNHKLFNRAKAKWELLSKDGHFSVPAEIGKTAIISSFFTDEPPDTRTGISELTAFRTEAKEIAARVQTAGGTPELAIDATRDEITSLIQDPEVATMYVIGNGSLSTLMLDEKDYYDWEYAAAATTHLKRGNFVQRQCGGLTRVLNVPLGLFVVSDARNVHAAFNDPEFYPLSLDDPVNEKVKPVFDIDQVDYNVIKDLGSVHLPGTT